MRRAEGELECLDRPVSAADRDASLADIDRLNAWFGGYALTLGAIRRMVERVPPARRLLVVDVGGGRGDFARRLIHRARRDGRRVHVVVVDRDPDLLAIAAAGRPAHPELSLVRAEATALPFPDRAAARLGVIVNDLLRTPLSLLLVWIATRLVARQRISRHDGPLSVRRSYSPEELRALAGKAGIYRLRLERYPWLGRLLAVIES